MTLRYGIKQSTGSFGSINIGTGVSGSNKEVLDQSYNLKEINNLNVSGAVDFDSTLNVDGQSTLASAAVSDLTDGRIVLAGTSGELEDSANLTFDGTDLTAASAKVSDLTSGRVVLAGTDGAIEDSANLTFDGTDLTAASAKVSDLTSGRVVIAGTDGAIEDSSNLTFDGTDLTAASAKVSDLTSGRVVLAGTDGAIEDSANMTFDGSALDVTGQISASVGMSGSAMQGAEGTFGTAKVSDLTSGRVVYAGTDGELQDDADFTFDGTTVTMANLDASTTAVLATAKVSDLTSGRVVLAGTDGEIEDSGNLTFNGSVLTTVSGNLTGDLTVAGNLTVQGTTTQVDTTNLQVKDKNILINDGGAAASAAGAGLDIEENGSVTGYIRVADDNRADFDLKAPDGSELKISTTSDSTLTMAANLTVENAAIVDQDLTTDASVQFAGINNSDQNISAVGDISLDTISAADSTITFQDTTTFASQTIEDLGTVTTADIDGGNIDGTIIGNDSPAAATVTEFEAQSSIVLNGSEAVSSIDTSIASSYANDDSIASSKAIKAYVDSQVGDTTLSGSGDSGTFTVDLDSQSLSIAGTSNEIETSASGSTLTIGLPDDVTIGNDLTVTNDLSVSNDLSVDGSITLGSLVTEDELALNAKLSTGIFFNANEQYDIGDTANRVNNIYATNVYTGDFHMKNERGDWTLFEESDHIRIRNNATGQEFKLDMTPLA